MANALMRAINYDWFMIRCLSWRIDWLYHTCGFVWKKQDKILIWASQIICKEIIGVRPNNVYLTLSAMF